MSHNVLHKLATNVRNLGAHSDSSGKNKIFMQLLSRPQELYAFNSLKWKASHHKQSPDLLKTFKHTQSTLIFIPPPARVLVVLSQIPTTSSMGRGGQLWL
jgi:hypothetical protein